jgi:excinuclease ABC subunit C
MTLESLLESIPRNPGCYLMKDARGKVLYVGKAASLRPRVRSYFQPSADHSPRIAAMVARVADIDLVLTTSEVEALVLESNLIKRHRPRYNVMLRDDKRYPYLKFTVERFPQLVECRRIEPDGARYFGPYTNAGAMRRFDRLIRRLFKIRRCAYNLSGEPMMRPCLDHHLGLCDAPCAALIGQADYAGLVESAVDLLRGRVGAVLDDLEVDMRAAAEALDFERAAELRDLLADVRLATERQRIVFAQPIDLDALAVAQHDDVSCVQVFFVREGRVIGDHHATVEGTAQDHAGVPLRAFLTSYYQRATDVPPHILLSSPIEDAEAVGAWLSERVGRKIELHVPERGDKRALVDMVRANADESLRAWLADRDQQRQRAEEATEDLRERLGLPHTPFRLECYDIATLGGRQNVGSMVVFVDGRPSRRDYRQFKVHLETDAPNDYAMMREVLTRRLTRAVESDPKWLPLPDLLVVDGGKGQLGVAQAVCAELGLQQVPLAALAKQQEHLFVPGHAEPVVLEGRMPALRLLRSIRDEAHRVANTFHQRLRRGAGLRSVLDDIPGVGPARRTQLLSHFRSTDAIRAAALDDIAALPGLNKSVAARILAFLNQEDVESAEGDDS